MIKRVNEFKMSYFSMLIIIPLNILTGTSKAFSLVFYLFILAVVLIINVAKLHRKCFDHKCILVILENIWIFMLFFELLNIWSTSTILQPYIVVRGWNDLFRLLFRIGLNRHLRIDRSREVIVSNDRYVIISRTVMWYLI